MEVLKRGQNGWKEKKGLKEDKKSTKIVEKVLEKESEKEAQQIVNIKSIANDLALNILQASKETNIYINLKGNKRKGLIDKKGLKQLTSALKDINDILVNGPQTYELSKQKLELDLIRLEREVAREDSTNTENLKDDSFIKALENSVESTWDDYEQ